MPKGSNLTPELSRKYGKLGGRPKGVLDPKTIARIQTQKAVQEIILKNAGFITDNLLRGSANLDVQASKELFDRAFGKAPQAIDMRVAVFSLKDLNERANRLEQKEKEQEKKTE